MDEHGTDVPEAPLTDLPIKDRRVPRYDSYNGPPAIILAQRPSRRYLPTFAELVDRLSIVQLKQVFIPEHAGQYAAEIALIEHDLDLMLEDGRPITARHIRAMLVLMLTNRFIWENESKARAGGPEQDRLLKLTHSVNGVRNTAKNVLSEDAGERLDHKVDALAADLPAEFGNWKIW